MGTSADEVVDRFMMQIMNDNTLNTLYNTSGSTTMVNYTEAWLLSSIDEFARVCTEDLTYAVGSTSNVGSFTATLTQRSINILSRIMVKQWLQQQVSNSLAFGRYFSDREFRMSAPMLPSLRGYLIEVTENIDKMLSDYAWDKNVNWDSWQNQIFDVFNT
jgi:uncharacterized protein YggL (DUF469 family)